MVLQVKQNTSRKWSNPFGRKSGKQTKGSKQADEASQSARTEADDSSFCAKSQDTAMYGYGDAAPDADAATQQVDYGYGAAAPDTAAKVDYGYGDAAPDSSSVSPRNSRVPRRSSMKGSSPSSRRASIGPCGEPMTLRLPGNQEPVRRRRSITFNQEVKVKRVDPVRSLTKNPESLWFQDEEYDMIKEKTVALIHRASIDGDLSDSGRKLCTRGLEKWMCPERTQVKKRQAWDNVLNEQYLQHQDGEYDEEHLAMMYKYSTARSQLEATKRAQNDAEDIKSYLAPTRRFNRRMSM
ncbi:MAG: hypothetical protein SGILL_007252 [Bacillariaceae sp.]